MIVPTIVKVDVYLRDGHKVADKSLFIRKHYFVKIRFRDCLQKYFLFVRLNSNNDNGYF